MTYEILERRHEADPSGDEHERLTLSLNTFAVREKHHFTGELFRYWDSKRRWFGGLPLADDFKPLGVFDDELLECFGLIDVSSPLPDQFVMIDHSTLQPKAYGVSLIGEQLARFPNRLHANALVREYHRCRLLARPFYHEVSQTIGKLHRHYSRVTLPVVSSSGAVTRIAYAVRRFVDPYGRQNTTCSQT